MALKQPFANKHGFDALYGLELLELSEELARGQVVVRDELKQPAGSVHGGVYAAIAESLATLGTGLAIPQGKAVAGLSNQTSFLRPITDGVVHAEARCRHKGRTTLIWEVEMRDDADRLCALTRVTIAAGDFSGA